MASIDSVLDDIATQVQAIVPAHQARRDDVFRRVRTDAELVSGQDRMFQLRADNIQHTEFTNCDWRSVDVQLQVIYQSSGTGTRVDAVSTSDRAAQDLESIEALLTTLDTSVTDVRMVDPESFEFFIDYEDETGAALLTARASCIYDKGA